MGDHPTERKCTLSPDFENVLNCDNFVDKSGLILAIVKSDIPVILCTAPRRFGKTVNLTMLQRFLELEVDENGIEITTVLEEKVNYKLFNSARFKLKVMDQRNKNFVTTHFGQYPIITLNFQCSGPIRNQSDAVNVCRRAIREAFQQHEYLYQSTVSPLKDDEKDVCRQWCSARAYKEIPEEDVQAGLVDLVVYLNKFHKKKVFLLVDEYDSIVSNALYNLVDAKLNDLTEVASFAIGAIGDALKRVSKLFQGVFMTGILDIAGITISSVLGNLKRLQFGTPNLCQDYYGFSEDEVDMLFDRFEVEEGLRTKAKAKYNGYYNGDKQRLYNPQSVVRFLKNLQLGEYALQNYWQQSGYIHKMYNLFNQDVVPNLLTSLLQSAIDMPDLELGPLELSELQSLYGILVHSNLDCKKDIIVRFFISLGYLTYTDSKLQIPNGELIQEFTKKLQTYFFIEIWY
ncbi:uncharacterized protein LOC135134792 [Zophobas morio]|uniref:uncharacterized protein LOC135134792 n=1 Tax=Zophobas morio TaxID=2755281 RepID=UPI00308376F0